MNNGAEHGQRAGDEGNDSTALNARPGYIYIYYVDRRKSAADDQEMASADIHHPHAPVFVFLVKHDPNEDLDRDLAERLIDQIESDRLPVLGYAMEDLVVRHPGYMLFVWRDPDTNLTDVIFTYDKDSGKINHSFGNKVMLPKIDDRSILYRLNTRTNKDYKPLKDKERETFNVTFVDGGVSLTDNETTTNMGP